jgi:hypothetical protein
MIYNYLALIIIIAITYSLPALSTLNCFDHESPFHKNQLKLVDCSLITESNQGKKQVGNDSMFVFDITCQSKKSNFCEKVRKNLETTGQIITNLLKLKESITVGIIFHQLEQSQLGK